MLKLAYHAVGQQCYLPKTAQGSVTINVFLRALLRAFLDDLPPTNTSQNGQILCGHEQTLLQLEPGGHRLLAKVPQSTQVSQQPGNCQFNNYVMLLLF